MTREEAKKILEAYIACESKKAHFECDDYNCDDNCPLRYEMGTVGEHNEAINMAIQALEQEPSEDAISREAVLEAIDVKAWEFCDYLISKNRNDEQKPVSHFADNLRECVREELPSVKPQDCHIYYHTGYQQALTDVRQEIYRHWHEEPCVVEHRCLDEIITIIDKCGGRTEWMI